MADKQVNININYKVNTVEVQKAEQLLKQAQTASTSFENSAKKAGNSTEDAFKKVGFSIETLNAKVLSLKDRITQSSDPKKIAQLSAEYKRLKTQLDEVNKAAFQTPKAIAETGKATQSLAGQLGGLYTAVKLAFTAGIIKEVVTTTLELAKLSGNVEGVERAFNRAFANPVFLMSQLKAATHGTVTEFELMQRTLQATNLGVAVEQLPILFEFAAARAQQTGESVDYLVDSIVRGIGRKSILVLDNLGLSATRLREQFNGASLASQSVADVTRGVAEIAKVELGKMGGYAETAATKVDQLTANVSELRIEVAKKVESSWLIDLFNKSAEGLKMLVKGQKELDNEFIKSQAGRQVDAFINEKSFKEQEKNAGAQVSLIIQEIAERQRLIRVREEEIKQAIEKRNGLNIETVQQQETYRQTVQFLEASKEGLSNQINSQKESKGILEASIPILKNYINQIQNRTLLEKEEVGIIEQLQIDIETLGDKIKQAHSVTDIENYNRQLVILEARLKELNDLGKNFVNPFASQVFDIKAKLSGGGLKAKDLVNSEDLKADTDRLFKEIGESAAKSFDLGVANEVDTGISKLQETIERRKGEIISAGIDITANALTELATMEANSYDERLRKLGEYYDGQILLAGDNERAKDRLRLEEKKKTDKLRREEAKKEQQARLYAILLNTAAGIAKAFATSATIYDAYVNAAIVAVEGAAQYAVASRSPRGFAKGVLNLNGPGTGTSDSISARLSKGESVMTAKEWQTSKNVLKEVRAKKLDDKVLSDLKSGRDPIAYGGGFNDKNILSKLDEVKNAFPDVEERAGLIYTSKVKSKNYRMMVRKSSMSS